MDSDAASQGYKPACKYLCVAEKIVSTKRQQTATDHRQFQCMRQGHIAARLSSVTATNLEEKAAV